VRAKLAVIGRSYSTGIERKVRSDGTQGSAISQLAEYVDRNHRAVDEVIDVLRGHEEPLTTELLKAIVDGHGKLLRLIEGVTRTGQTPRSFVSKYLHFHAPVVPIYDSVASGALRALVR
jgi:hypothetical protein